MKCPKCKSENVSVDLVQVEGKTKKHGNGLGGHINNTRVDLQLYVPWVCLTWYGRSQKEMRRQSLRTRPYVSARTAVIPGTPKG